MGVIPASRADARSPRERPPLCVVVNGNASGATAAAPVAHLLAQLREVCADVDLIHTRTLDELVSVWRMEDGRDSQCGMRLMRGRALSDMEFPAGGMESETRHLKRCLLGGIPVAWVPIPAIYKDERSSFRTLRDSVVVMRAALSSHSSERKNGPSSSAATFSSAGQGSSVVTSDSTRPSSRRAVM